MNVDTMEKFNAVYKALNNLDHHLKMKGRTAAQEEWKAYFKMRGDLSNVNHALHDVAMQCPKGD